jgi:hypothetical protein
VIWILWFLLLVVQNAAFTLVSRARNSDSLLYHAKAAVLSNGVWYASQLILFASMYEAMKTGSYLDMAITGVVYTAGTMTGSLAMHAYALKYERKKGIK